MRRLSVILAAALLVAGAVAAQPPAPPLPLAVTFVPDGETPSAFGQVLNAIGLNDRTFSITTPDRKIPATAIRSCLSATARELCFRRRLDESKETNPTAAPHIVLIAEELRRGLRVSCLGGGRDWKDEAKQVISVDVQIEARGPEAQRLAQRAKVVQCMLTARQETIP